MQECKLEECPGVLWPGIHLRNVGSLGLQAVIKKALCHSMFGGELFCSSWCCRRAVGRKICMLVMMHSFQHRLQDAEVPVSLIM